MTRRIPYSITLILVILVSMPGCEKYWGKAKLSVKKLQEFYPGDIAKVDRIEVRSGSTGETKTFTDKQQVQEWIDSIREIPLKLDPNQEKRVGYDFYVDLYEGKEKRLRFTSIEIREHYYLHTKELTNRIQALFEGEP